MYLKLNMDCRILKTEKRKIIQQDGWGSISMFLVPVGNVYSFEPHTMTFSQFCRGLIFVHSIVANLCYLGEFTVLILPQNNTSVMLPGIYTVLKFKMQNWPITNTRFCNMYQHRPPVQPKYLHVNFTWNYNVFDDVKFKSVITWFLKNFLMYSKIMWKLLYNKSLYSTPSTVKISSHGFSVNFHFRNGQVKIFNTDNFSGSHSIHFNTNLNITVRILLGIFFILQSSKCDTWK